MLRDVLTAARDSGRGVLLLTHTEVPGDLVDRTIELRVAGDGVRTG